MSQTREGESVAPSAPSDFMPTSGKTFELCPIAPCNGSCHHGELNVIGDGMGIARLAFTTSDLLFDGFNLPATQRHPRGSQGQRISVYKSLRCSCFAQNPSDSGEMQSIEIPDLLVTVFPCRIRGHDPLVPILKS